MAVTPSKVRPYGTWPSPITAAGLTLSTAAVVEIRGDGADTWWSEPRPSEGGRTQLVRRDPSGATHDLFAPWDPDGPGRDWNARTAVLEYGGGAWGVHAGVGVFADWADQRLYRVDPGDGAVPVPLTPEPVVARGLRWSEPEWLDDGWVICQREDHEPETVADHGEARNEIVAIPLDGSAAQDRSRMRVLVSEGDFVRSAVTDGASLAWLGWNHPDMPWDATALSMAEIVRDDAGDPVGIVGLERVAGGEGESIVQPGFTASGDLVFCTDRTGWWNPWRRPASGGEPVAVLADGGVEAEIGGPLWVGGLRWWAEVAPGRLVVRVTAEGADGLGVIDETGRLRRSDTPVTDVGQVVAGPGGTALVVAGTPTSEPTPYRFEIDPAAGSEPSLVALRPPGDPGFGPEYFSVPTHLSFPSADGRTAHALFYPPVNPDAQGPDGERPPLIVMIHGGPTTAARHRLELSKQFWTSRGFAVVDVNYGGSTGYGRPYRNLLLGRWGEVDVEDAVAAARHLAAEGLVDGDRLAIRGGSAGGFTTLAALCFHGAFAAGASHYGVTDLAALATDTHKFESRYLDSLVGPWPQARSVYEARSPVHHAEGFSAPLIILQGSEDEVVPPSQAEMIVAALAERQIPHAYVLFEGEQHGFRQAANIVAALEAELWFYGRVFGFVPADDLDPVGGAVGL